VFAAWSRAVFDFDGVLLDSNPAKTLALRTALTGEPNERVEAFVRWHRDNGGVSRYEKLRRYFEDEAPRPDAAGALQRAVEVFAAVARRELHDCPLVPGVEGLLAGLRASGVACVVVSGADEVEVREELARRGLASGFEGIFGSPTPKERHFERLVERGWLRGDAVSFGDAELDMQLAERFGLSFVFVAGCSDWAQGRVTCAGRGHHVVETLADLVL
jgi:phosphoglycolate phosphatase-like HAD superfamily hydrolase